MEDNFLTNSFDENLYELELLEDEDLKKGFLVFLAIDTEFSPEGVISLQCTARFSWNQNFYEIYFFLIALKFKDNVLNSFFF